jgi:hypothetical protein
MQRALRQIALSSVACPALPYLSKVSRKLYDFSKEILNIKYVVIFSTSSSEIFLSLRRIQRYFIINMHRSSCKIPIILIGFCRTYFFSGRFSKKINFQISSKSIQWEPRCSLWTNRQIDGETDRRTGRQTQTGRQTRRI